MPYNRKVLIGNWSEERLQDNYNFMVFLRKRDRSDLLLQKARSLFSNLLGQKKVQLSGETVLYGYISQIHATDMPGPTQAGSKREYGLVLSSLVLPRQVDCTQDMADGVLMTLSGVKDMCLRNTFRIVSAKDESIVGEAVKYGDEFYMESQRSDPKAAPLYVSYSSICYPAPDNRMPIHLGKSKNTSSRWVALPLSHKDQIEKLGTPIKSGSKLLIINRVSDLPLCVMNQNWMVTFFGPECGITCRKFVDGFKRHGAENVFSLVSDVTANVQH